VCVWRKEARFEPPDMNADALPVTRWLQQCCGHFQCDQWTLDDCCSQLGTVAPCGDVAAGPRIGHIRRRSEWYACDYGFECLLTLCDGVICESGGVCLVEGGAF
jgi:hypothetical protein